MVILLSRSAEATANSDGAYGSWDRSGRAPTRTRLITSNKKGNMNYMRFLTNFLASLLFTGILALAPATSFAHGGGGGGGHFGGGGGDHFGGGGHFGSGGYHGHYGDWHHSYDGHYGYYGYPYYGYAYPSYDDNDAYDVQPEPSEVAPYESTSLLMSVQKELTQLGYYHGPINGVAGSETEQAVRWFQSVDHLPVTGQIDSATLQALRIT